MNSLEGTGSLVRLALRRDRVMLPIWLACFVVTAAFSASATVGLYPTEASRVQAAETFNKVQSLVALYGRIYDTSSLGELALIKMGGLGAIFVAVLAIVLTIRHTRTEEETGRSELVGATAVGRLAPLTATLLVNLATFLLLAVLTALGLIGAGLPADGSFAFGLAWGGVGIAFATIAAVAAQLTSSARSATGLSVAVLGGVYLLRAAGDAASADGPRWLSWLSPIGWGQQFRPYAGNRWWVLLLTAGLAAILTGLSYLLVTRRDLSAGLLPQRGGPAAAPAGLRGPLSLAWRLQRGTLLAWAAGYALMGLVFGNLATSVTGFLDNSTARDLFTKLGGQQQQIVDAYLASVLGIVGVITAAYTIQATLRLSAEETAQHAEPVLATRTGRVRWAGGHILVAVLGSTFLMVLMGLVAGLAYGAHAHDLGQVGRVLGGALVQLPAVWVLTGVVVAGYGLLPRVVAVAWAFLAAFVVLGELGPLLRLNHWLLDASPFGQVPRLPGNALHTAPVLVLLLVAAALMAVGLAAFRRRDVPVG